MSIHEQSYYESAEGIKITRARAEHEVLEHYCSVQEFIADVGDKREYDAQEVLDWLGY